MIIVFKFISVFLLLWIGYEFATFPVAGSPLLAGFVAYILLLWRFSSGWLIILPAILPVLDLTPWSGRILVTEFDLFIATTVAVGFFFNRFSWQFLKSFNKAGRWLLGSFIVSQLMSLLIGYFDLQSQAPPSFYLYHSPLNSFRVSKGFWEALLLLPMLAYEKEVNKPIGRYFSIGMISALTFCIISIMWERLFFPGLLDFKSNYRVSGMFSGMLLGGALVDGFLALSFPFFITCFLIFRHRWLQFLGVLLFAGGIYCFLVTFTRTTYLALFVIFAILYIGTHKLEMSFFKNLGLRVSMIVIVTLLVIPVIGGEFIQKRFRTTANDFQHRISHWSGATDLMEEGWRYIWGMGKGTFPINYFDKSAEAIDMSSFQMLHIGNHTILSFIPSDKAGDLYIRQRIHLNEIGEYEVRIRLRSWSNKREKLLVELCERNIMPLGHECNWLGFPVEASEKSQWVTVSRKFDSITYQGFLGLFKPLEISLMNRGLGGKLDIASIEIYSAKGQQVINNANFVHGFDHWVFSSGNHLAWHIKNIWVSAFFEGGIVELVILSCLLIVLMHRCYTRSRLGNPFYLAMLSSLTAFMVIGLFGSIYDDPRVSWLFFTITSMVIVKPENPGVENSQVPWLRILMGFLIILALLAIAGFFQLMHSFNLSASQLLAESEKRLGINVSLARKLVEPKAQFVNQVMDGSIKIRHPRILFGDLPKGSQFELSDLIQQRIKNQSLNNQHYLAVCGSQDLLFMMVCWLSNPNKQVLQGIKQRLLTFPLNRPTADTTYSNAWELALAYDLVFDSLLDSDRLAIENKLSQAVKDMLLILDDESTSLWHGRSTHAATAWICAIVLSERIDRVILLQRRAQGHFLNAIDGLAYTTVWPGGYNYWIQNRAFLFALAASAYLNGVEKGSHAEKIRDVMRQIGYWTLYATRPDNRVEGYGDEGSRVDLKDETRRVIDLIAGMTKDSVLAGYSNYLDKLHGSESYYRGYRWGFLLFNDPSVWTVGDGSFASITRFLPVARLFGAKSTNYAYFRSGWDKDATFISYKAGHTFAHHGHYDAGHFTLYKGAPLVINSSTYNGFFTPHRLNYAIRTIAKNSLLIQKRNETVQPNRFFKENVADGGQRLTMPTGSSIQSVAHWFENYRQDKHFEGAELINFAAKENEYAYIVSDLTPAYNNAQYDENDEGGKVNEVIRQLLYLPDEDNLFVFDRVNTTKIDYLKKWLLHTVYKPIIQDLSVIKGDENNGVLESYAKTAMVENGRGRLRIHAIYPEYSVMRLVGGDDFQYYVETDGDDAILNGVNFNQGSSEQNWHDVGKWRIEIQPKIPAKQDVFLVALSPSMDAYRYEKIEKIKVDQPGVYAVASDETLIVFGPQFGGFQINLNLTSSKRRIILAGLSDFKQVQILQNNQLIAKADVVNGLAISQFDNPISSRISIKW
jgi:heparinase II/III-like protein